ncbi:type I restriction enzyme, R subunit [Methanoculleus bourgensis MS2]|uniref:Type I restriction enzyme, R subunit n=1 Tax=Methanoculleus bourgensis (strain ATCC 43281 / DSM 3045 / OCM 15 / MS2) TaxID=1201294 RepID=I7KC51_METBM|nr:DEAD/DEAH box helicase family protein [Methanoculleus bourgensis]CCJ35846.1 type I restriction enzyme, R subunit [Methanoculleus bourgensis MS2]
MITEADTCRKYVLPKLYGAGWTDDQISEQKTFTDGQILVSGDRVRRGKPKRADYLLRIGKNYPIAVVEAKAAYKSAGDGMQQAKEYARMLGLRFAYATNGHEIIEYDDTTHLEQQVETFPSPTELWSRLKENEQIPSEVEEKLLEPFFNLPNKMPRYYQEIAINRTIKEIYRGGRRILLTLATGTGKTYIAFQIIWKLWNQRWNRDGGYRRPKILYLADRNILIDDPKDNLFAVFGDARWKIERRAVKSRDLYFATYQAIASDERRTGLYRSYARDFFDFIVVDECHRGSARDDSNWREILNYFAPAVQLGMTATPLRDDNRDTYAYFGNPVYTYSLRQGIQDGFLAPYKVHRVVTSVDATGWRPERGERDRRGNPIPDGIYETPDFERVVALRARTWAVARHLTEHLRKTNRFDKTIVFCVDQEHADEMRRALNNLNRDLVKDYPDYVARVVSDEGDIGRGFLEKFMDIEEETPVIVTTSKLLTTGVNVPTCKNVAIFRVIRSMTEFKQVIGRGTRIREDYGKLFFTILDYTGSATRLFADPEFDGEPIEITDEEIDGAEPAIPDNERPDVPTPPQRSVLADDREERTRKYYVDGGEVEISTELVYELDSSGNRLRTIEYTDYTREQVQGMYASFDDLRSQWSSAEERKAILDCLEERGISFAHLAKVTGQAEADPFDLLCHVAFNTPILTRRQRAEQVKRKRPDFFAQYSPIAQEILHEILDKYIEYGFEHLGDMQVLKVPPINEHGNVVEIATVFGGLQKLKQAVTELQNLVYA